MHINDNHALLLLCMHVSSALVKDIWAQKSFLHLEGAAAVGVGHEGGEEVTSEL
jgi:hypothetical protein